MLLSFFHSLIFSSSCSSNLILLFLIIFHTPKELKAYSTMLMTCCIYELITAFSTFILFPRIVPLGF
ncbi:hypothetical protein PMAYCL1PPCAC_17247 [Pristionchus mayeri]|uniref:G protein-coupled receptor n=1 Tax=Pristionchus mayeri TaxID=1317129 RepID=A0AAN5I049_9BILA|nr:hypothetical protein PMAYCL1PPCAC_17247 [Pristionchus mayeri]